MKKKLIQIRPSLSSGIIRLIIIVLAVVLPLNFLTLLLANIVIQDVERQVSLETQNALNSYLTQIDNAISRISIQLNRLAREDPDYLRLRDKMVDDEDEYYRQLQAIVNLRNTVEAKLEDNMKIEGVFIMFPKKEIVLQGGNIGYLSALIRNHMVKAAESAEETSSNWHLENVQGEVFLWGMHKYKDSYYGAWISERHLMSEFPRQSLDSFYLLEDRNGVVYSSDDEFVTAVNTDRTSFPYLRNNYVLAEAPSLRSDLTLVQVISKKELNQLLPALNRILRILSILAILIVPAIILAMRRLIITPVNKLTKAMEQIEQGNVDYRIAKGKGGQEFEQINQHFNHMMDELAELRIGYYEEKLKNQKIKMRFLGHQIQPHFILNTLNILYSYEQEEYPLIQKMIMHLSKYFRYVVKANSDFVPLEQEIDHVRNYFTIQQERFHRTFEAEVKYDEELGDSLILPLMLQTFAENAIKHALIPREMIRISINVEKADEEHMQICISDTGAGMSEEIQNRIVQFTETGEYQKNLGVGIQNVIDRMNILYKKQGSLRVETNEPRGTRILIILPIIRKDPNEE